MKCISLDAATIGRRSDSEILEIGDEHRSEGLRILICSPLAATYEVRQRTHEVAVAHVWRFRVG